MEKKEIILGVVGSRNLTCKNRVYFELNELAKVISIKMIVSGDCPTGIDKFAKEYAKEYKIPYRGFEAKWKDFSPPCVMRAGNHGTYNAMAGPNRNTLIADFIDKGIVFWDGKSTGTKDVGNKIYLRGKLLKKIEMPNA